MSEPKAGDFECYRSELRFLGLERFLRKVWGNNWGKYLVFCILQDVLRAGI